MEGREPVGRRERDGDAGAIIARVRVRIACGDEPRVVDAAVKAELEAGAALAAALDEVAGPRRVGFGHIVLQKVEPRDQAADPSAQQTESQTHFLLVAFLRIEGRPVRLRAKLWIERVVQIAVETEVLGGGEM